MYDREFAYNPKAFFLREGGGEKEKKFGVDIHAPIVDNMSYRSSRPLRFLN